MQGGVDNLGLWSYADSWWLCCHKQRLMPGRHHAFTWLLIYPNGCMHVQATEEAYRATRGALYFKGLCSDK